MSYVASNQQIRRRGSATDVNMKCPKCDVIVVPKKDQHLTCKLCDSVWHKECLPAGMDEDNFKVLKKNEKKDVNLYWYCTKQCDRAATKFLSGMAYFEEELAKTKQTVQVIEKTVVNIQEGSFSDKMTETVKTIAKGVVHDSGAVGMEKEGIEEMVNMKTKEQIEEAENKAKRKTNLIIFKLPESKKTTSNDKKQEDADRVQNILTDCKINHIPTDIIRLGKADRANKGEERANSHRPIRVTFGSQSARDETLASLIKKKRDLLGKDSDSLLPSIGFRKDMTPQERREDEELYKIIKQKREESKASGDESARWVVRDGRVVNLVEWRAARKEGEGGEQA